MSAAPSLAAVPTNSLLEELQKRIECASKKERRTIFIGALAAGDLFAWAWRCR
jgi:adenylate kinase